MGLRSMPTWGVCGPPLSGGVMPAVPTWLDRTESIVVPKVNHPGILTLWCR